MKKKLLSVFFCLLLVSGVFGAGQQEEAASGGGSIEYVSMWNAGEPQAVFLEEAAKSFEAETGISVDITWAGRDVLTKIRSRLLMNDSPDLVDQDFSELSGALLKDGQVMAEPITDFMYKTPGPEGQKKVMDLFDESLVQLYSLDDEIYFFPYEYITSGFFYDKSVFKANGIEAPSTWDEFISNNETLKAAGIPPLALDGNISFYNAYYYYWAISRVAGPGHLMTAVSDESGETWRDPVYLKAAKLVEEISASGKDHFQPGYAGSNYPAAQADWALNKSGNILCGTWIPSETKSQQTSTFDVGFYPFPEIPGSKGSVADVEAYLIGFAVPKGAPNAAAAKEFMKYVVKIENANQLARDTFNISARADAEYPAILADVKPVLDNARGYHVSYDGVMQKHPEWFSNVFYPNDNELVFGYITAEEFINKMVKGTADYWAKKK